MQQAYSDMREQAIIEAMAREPGISRAWSIPDDEQ
jgi:hypothetical protein